MNLIFGYCLVIVSCILVIPASGYCAPAPEAAGGPSDQQINDFSLTGYGDKGKKAWDLAGKTADIFDDVVKLKEVTGNMYGSQENMRLTADKGDFNKTDGKMHLEDNVVITTTSGMKLTTDSLDYDRKKQSMMTDDLVNIERANMKTTAIGAKGQMNMKKVSLEKDVRLDINPEQPPKEGGAASEKIVITCDGPLEVDYEKNIAYFNNNVKVERDQATIYSDIMHVYFNMGGSKDKAAGPQNDEKDKLGSDPAALMGGSINKIIAKGNVKIVRGQNISYSQEAVYNAADKKITLAGQPRLILYSTEGMDTNALTGS